MWEVAEIWEAAHSLKSKPFKAELTGCLRASPPLSDTPGRKDLVCHAFIPSPMSARMPTSARLCQGGLGPQSFHDLCRVEPQISQHSQLAG